MNGWTLTRVWRINGHLVVADTVDEAVSIFKKYVGEDWEPDSIERVSGLLKSYNPDALIKEDSK